MGQSNSHSQHNFFGKHFNKSQALQPPPMRMPVPEPYIPKEQQQRDDDGDENILVPEYAADPHGDLLSPAQAESALRDLMASDTNAEVDVNIEDAIVPGFRENIRLKPYQIAGRAWMTEREDVTKKRYGGLLCDDMGACLNPRCLKAN